MRNQGKRGGRERAEARREPGVTEAVTMALAMHQSIETRVGHISENMDGVVLS